jgi:hypothetical protein
MGQTTHQIENQIEKTRDDLGANFQELEQKVKEITDWRHHYQNHPMTLMGVAFAGGLVVATIFGGTRRRRSVVPSPVSTSVMSRPRRKAVDTWDQIQEALVGVAAARVTDFVGELIPGFAEQFRGKTTPPSSQPN